MENSKEDMMELQLTRRNIHDPLVLQAMWEVDRRKFVPEKQKIHAYEDRPLPIGKGQTISQPYIVAYMIQALKLNAGDRVLEIGAGCGYNAAVLSKIASKVYTIEIIEWLAELATENLKYLGIENVIVRHGDGYKGWEEEAPFDAIIITAAPPEIPEPLKNQLKTGGKLLAPVGNLIQHLTLIEKINEDHFSEKTLLPVQFVPMTGEAQK